MAIEESLIRLKELIFAVDKVADQQRLICAIIEEYKKESARTAEDAAKHSALQREHSQFKQSQFVKPTYIECEVCRNKAAKFIGIRPSTLIDYGPMGLKEKCFKCDRCGAEFEQQIQP